MSKPALMPKPAEEQLTEVERLKMENSTLKHHLMQQQSQAVQAERATLIAQIEINHPGFKWDDRQGVLQPVNMQSAAASE
jgi:hypothetical protein